MRDAPTPRAMPATVALPHDADARHVIHATECLAGGMLAYLATALDELAALGVRQTLIYSRRPDTPADVRPLLPAFVTLVEVPRAQGSHLAFISGFVRALLATLDRQPAHALHLHSSKAGFVGRLAVAIACRGAAQPRVVYSPHGLAFLDRRRLLASSAYRLLERIAGLVDFQPVACGDSEADALALVTRRTPFVLENPVDPAFFEVVHREPATPAIITAGRICEQKAPDLFAELAVRTHVDHPAARFVWIGDGNDEGRQLLRAAGVEVTGWLPQAEVRQRMAGATLYVQSSRWEGMPLAVIQAMAVGLPCVVTDVVGNRDAVIDGSTGFVVNGSDELVAHVDLLLREPALRHALSVPARAAAQRRFGRARFRQALAQLYRLDDRHAAGPAPAPAPAARPLGTAGLPAA